MCHNHRVGEVIIKHYPSSKKLSKEKEKAVCDIVSLKPNNKNVRDFVVRKYGKLVTLKDIQNIKTKVREQTRKGLQDAELLLEKLKESLENDQGANGGVTVDEEDTLAIIYYQSSSMVNMFKKFPEIVFVDGTYNVNKLGMPSWLRMALDMVIIAFMLLLLKKMVPICNKFFNLSRRKRSME